MLQRTPGLLFILPALASGAASFLMSGAAAAAPAPEKVAVKLSPKSIVANGTSTTKATATVTAGSARVSGHEVVFSAGDPGIQVGRTVAHPNGTYTATLTSSTSPGTTTITATDTSDPSASPQPSGRATLTETPAPARPVTLSLAPFPSAAVTNETVTLVATVDSRVGSPSGTITISDAQGAPLPGCVPQSVTPTKPTAFCQTTFAASTSPEQLEATYSPKRGSALMGASAVATVTVGRDSTSTAVNAGGTVQTGTPTTYTATVAPPPVRPGPTAPSGSVEFFDGNQPIGACIAQTLTNGHASCTVTYKSAGTHDITAQYSGDTNFLGSASSPSVVSVPVKVLGIISATMQWSFYFAPNYTKVVSLAVNGASPGGSVVVNCHGRGCPFGKRTIPVTKTRPCGAKGKRTCLTHGKVDLTSALRNHRLRLGTRLKVEIVRRGWIGKYYMFTVRSRRGPQIQIACLAPDGTSPGVGC